MNWSHIAEVPLPKSTSNAKGTSSVLSKDGAKQLIFDVKYLIAACDRFVVSSTDDAMALLYKRVSEYMESVGEPLAMDENAFDALVKKVLGIAWFVHGWINILEINCNILCARSYH